ncbi:SURF1 family cytochrome oxidase biogenesis protein [Corynebacterium phoceense]
MLKTFLKPQWVLLTLFVVVFSYLAFTTLAPWQLGKDHDIVERNHEIEAAYESDPVPLTDAVTSTGEIANKEWTRVTLQGRYLADKEVLLRLRPVESGPTYQSLVPFETNDGLTILVDRGWVAAGEGNAVPTIEPAPTGEVTLTAMLRTAERVHTSAPIEDQGYTQVYSINPSQVGKLENLTLGTDYVQISHDDQPGVLNPIPVPQLDRGSHLSYGFQWIAFGIMAPLGLIYFVYAEIRERRRLREEEAAMAAAATTDAETAGSAPEPSPAPAESSESAESAETAATSAAPAETAAPATPAAPASRRSRTRYGDAKPDYYEKFNKRGRERF